jgi:nicotinamide riboside transporter PnuC
MENKDLFTNEEDKSLLNAFGRWEKKRLFYNTVVGAAGILTTVLSSQKIDILYLIGIIFYGVAANLFYCPGFLTEVAIKYYFKSDIDFSDKRNAFFWIGLIFSLLITLAFEVLLSMPIFDI